MKKKHSKVGNSSVTGSRGNSVKGSNNWRLFLASGCFLGLSPIVPGSFGALLGLVWYAVAWALGWGDSMVRLWCLIGVVFFSVLHYWLTPWAQRYWHDFDPKHFVLDEVVGFLCVPIFWVLPVEAAYPIWVYALFGFVVFRILDAIKLPIARYIDRNIHSANGVLFDDVISAIYSAVVVSLVAGLIN